MRDSTLIKEAWKTMLASILRSLLTWLLYLHFIPLHPLLHYAYHTTCWTVVQLCRCRPVEHIHCRRNPKKGYSFRQKMQDESRKKKQEKNWKKRTWEHEDNRVEHDGRSIYFKPQIVTENCLVFKSQRLFALRIPFFASIVLRQNGNADWSIVPRGPLQKDSAVTRRIKWRKSYTVVTQRNRTFEKPSARSANNTASWLLKLSGSSLVCYHSGRVRPSTRTSLFPSLSSSLSLRFPIFVPCTLQNQRVSSNEIYFQLFFYIQTK